MPIRLPLGHVDEFDDTVAQVAHQLGLQSVQFHTPSNLATDIDYGGFEELQALRNHCDRHGLRIDGLENVPAEHFRKIQRGLPGCDEQIEKYQRTICNMSETGCDLLGFNFLPTYVWRTDMNAVGRGEASVTAFNPQSKDHSYAYSYN